MSDVIEDGIGGFVPSPQAMAAVRLAEALQSTPYGDQVVYTGHSLGGRLASVAGMVSGSPAVTFNAAGVSDPMVAYLAGMRGITPEQLHAEMNGGTVRGYQTTDDPLTDAQENVPFLNDTMHDAPGTQHTLPGKVGSWLGGHDMAPLIESMNETYGCNSGGPGTSPTPPWAVKTPGLVYA